MSFQNPWVLIFIPALFILAYQINRRKRQPAFRFSSIQLLTGLKGSLKAVVGANIIYIRCIALSLFIIALARLQSPVEETLRRTEGIDIVLTIDVSSSMLAEDFTIGNKRYNREDVVKRVVPDFVRKRRNDRLAIVVFASSPYTRCPLTLNHGWVLKNLEQIKAGVLGNRTAIGSAMAVSLNRLKRSKAKAKVIILLTDGRNNAGEVTPMTAAEMASSLNVKIYTIGVGTFGSVPFPILDKAGNVVGYQQIEVDLDEDLLKDIASQTGGRYFRATDTKSLERIYKEIDRLEKVPIEEKGYDEYDELFPKFLIPGLLILILEVLLSNTLLKRIP
jgi:Ca-activated chloride channel family protein